MENKTFNFFLDWSEKIVNLKKTGFYWSSGKNINYKNVQRKKWKKMEKKETKNGKKTKKLFNTTPFKKINK